jgi:hypothetical protein
LIAFTGIEEKDMIGISHGLILTDVTQIYSPIRKYEMRSGSEFLRGAMSARARAGHVSQRHYFRMQ